MAQTISEYLTFRGDKWVNKLFIEAYDIKFYYANIVDYTRIIMCIIAAYTITTDWHLLNAFLIFSATLLDVVDGPVTRSYIQLCSLGVGLDWTADVLSQIVMITWWARYDFNVVPWLLIVSFIEITTGVFDYAATTKLKYPIAKEKQSGFFVILHWSMSFNSYTNFGNFLWISYPSYCILRTLECCYGYNHWMSIVDFSTAIENQSILLSIFLLNRYCLLIPSILYIWCETAYAIHILQLWTEISRRKELADQEIIYDDALKSYQGGFIHYKSLSNQYKNLLENCYEDLQIKLKDEYQSAILNSEIFRINLLKHTDDKIKKVTLKEHKKLDEMVQNFIEKYYYSNSILLDNYGYILNPTNSRTQLFHIDYTPEYSYLFIPLVPLSVDNAIQYIIPSSSIDYDLFQEATKNPDRIDVNLLLKNENCYSVRQCIANSLTVLKMDFGTIHRTISNQETYNLPMFYISVIQKDTINQTDISDESIKKDL